MIDNIIEIHRQYNKCVQEERARGDKEQKASRAFLDENIIVRVGPSLPHGGTVQGIDAYLEMMKVVARSRRTIGGPPVIEYVEAGKDRLMVLIKFMAESPTTGLQVQMDMVEIFTFKNGKIASVTPYYWDSGEIVKALGGPDSFADPE